MPQAGLLFILEVVGKLKVHQVSIFGWVRVRMHMLVEVRFTFNIKFTVRVNRVQFTIDGGAWGCSATSG